MISTKDASLGLDTFVVKRFRADDATLFQAYPRNMIQESSVPEICNYLVVELDGHGQHKRLRNSMVVIARRFVRVLEWWEMESAHRNLSRQVTAGLSDGVKIAFAPGDDEKQRRRRLGRFGSDEFMARVSGMRAGRTGAVVRFRRSRCIRSL